MSWVEPDLGHLVSGSKNRTIVVVVVAGQSIHMREFDSVHLCICASVNLMLSFFALFFFFPPRTTAAKLLGIHATQSFGDTVQNSDT